MSGLSRLLTSLSVQCEVRVRHGMPKGHPAIEYEYLKSQTVRSSYGTFVYSSVTP